MLCTAERSHRPYEKDADGKFRVIPEQAEIVRELYKRYESGASLRNLQDWLEENQIKTVLGESKWTATSIKSINVYGLGCLE